MFQRHFRWAILCYISVLMIINFLDRIIISIATGPIMNEFNFTATQWGVILSAFFWGLVPSSLLGGIASDQLGPKKVWLWGVTWWSGFTMATAGAFNYVTFLVARIFFGFGEGPTLSNGVRVITDWVSPKEYSTAYGITFGGVYLGPALGAPIIIWLIDAYGWRVPFYVLGIVGLVWVIGWYKWFTDRPEDNPYMSHAEKKWILSEQQELVSGSQGQNKSIKTLLSIPKSVRGTILANLWGGFCFGYGLYFLMTWLPGYLSIQRGLSQLSMGFGLMFPWLGASFSQLVGGRLVDIIYRWTRSRRIARAYWAAGWFFVVSVSLILAVRVDLVVNAIILLTIASMANAFTSVTFGSVIAETVPNQAGSQAGLLQMCYTLPGILAPIITGYIIDNTHSFVNAFYLAAMISVSGIITILAFLRPPETLKRNSADITEQVTGYLKGD